MPMIAVKPVEREFAFTDQDFRFLAKLANSKTGIVLEEQKKQMMYGRLARRLRALGLDSFAEYCQFLQSNEGVDEVKHLVNAITTNLTSFFRESHHFDHLQKVLEALPKTGPSKRLRIWSSACSSGMEPYSIAMTMRQAIPDIDQWDARILATDIDSNMVNTGHAGIYNASDVEGVPVAVKSHMRKIDGNRVEMQDSLKKLIGFRQLNLLETWQFKGPFDAVFCRNVVIYFDKETKQKLFARMANMIKPDGLLYIGHSENLNGTSDRFESIGRTIYRKIK